MKHAAVILWCTIAISLTFVVIQIVAWSRRALWISNLFGVPFTNQSLQPLLPYFHSTAPVGKLLTMNHEHHILDGMIIIDLAQCLPHQQFHIVMADNVAVRGLFAFLQLLRPVPNVHFLYVGKNTTRRIADKIQAGHHVAILLAWGMAHRTGCTSVVRHTGCDVLSIRARGISVGYSEPVRLFPYYTTPSRTSLQDMIPHLYAHMFLGDAVPVFDK